MTLPAAADMRAAQALALLAVDPVGLGGAVLASRATPARDAWVTALIEASGANTPVRRIPLHVADDRLNGGLDLAATLASGRPIAMRGLLAEANGGIVVLANAERIAPLVASSIALAIENGHSAGHAARFAVVALDEGDDTDEAAPAQIQDRLAFRIDAASFEAIPAGLFLALDAISLDEKSIADDDTFQIYDVPAPSDIAEARRRLASVTIPDAVIAGLTASAFAIGVGSLRPPLLAVKAARAAAALAGHDTVTENDARLAAGLVLAHRATRLPPTADEEAADDAPPPPSDPADRPPEEPPPADASAPQPDDTDSPDTDADRPNDDRPLDDMLIAATKAAIPAGLLAQLQATRAGGRSPTESARSGAARKSLRHGRPAASRPGDPRLGGRLDLVATLRRAAPWQAIRRKDRGLITGESTRIEVRREDLVIRRYEEKSGTLLIFAVDASGSAALARLAEAKGAVEILLADCYARRDEVAVIAFRGLQPELLLPPTRALARAKRALAGLPGGGATPLAAALDIALGLASAARRKGRDPALVVLTDGRGNVARDGRTGRTLGENDALVAAAMVRATGMRALVIDTSDRAQPQAGQLAAALGAGFLALPRADARRLSAAVRAGLPGTGLPGN